MMLEIDKDRIPLIREYKRELELKLKEAEELVSKLDGLACEVKIDNFKSYVLYRIF